MCDFWHLQVQFDVTFAALPCSILSLDAMDISGEQHLDVVCIKIDRGCDMIYACYSSLTCTKLLVLVYLQKHDIIKKRIDSHGNVIESRPDGIGAPKVSRTISGEVHFLGPAHLHFIHKQLKMFWNYVGNCNLVNELREGSSNFSLYLHICHLICLYLFLLGTD